MFYSQLPCLAACLFWGKGYIPVCLCVACMCVCICITIHANHQVFVFKRSQTLNPCFHRSIQIFTQVLLRFWGVTEVLRCYWGSEVLLRFCKHGECLKVSFVLCDCRPANTVKGVSLYVHRQVVHVWTNDRIIIGLVIGEHKDWKLCHCSGVPIQQGSEFICLLQIQWIWPW